MDVGCPKCQTEYELEDARVPDEGVTVKCTTCSHIFRVKRESPGSNRAVPTSELPPPPPSREWRIRQPGGAVLSCRELTTLQKWIIENKVTRDDEISLTGETWKRLGNIPELASFFQIVDDAAKARKYEASLHAPTPVPMSPLEGSPIGPRVMQTPPPPPPTASPPPQKFSETLRGPAFVAPRPEDDAPGPVPVADAQPSVRTTAKIPQFSTPTPTALPAQPAPPVARPSTPRPSTPRPKPRSYEPTESQLNRAVGSGGARWWWLVALLAVAGGVAWYLLVYTPAHAPAKPLVVPDAGAEVATAVVAAEPSPPEQPSEPTSDAGPLDDAGSLDAGPLDAGPPDAGAADAGTADAGKRALSFDELLAQADSLRERDKPMNALGYYRQAQKLGPNRVEVLAGEGLSLLDLGNPTDAQVAFEQAVAVNPRYGPALMGLAEVHRTQGRNEKAIEYYQKYLEVLPDGTEAAVARNNIARLKK